MMDRHRGGVMSSSSLSPCDRRKYWADQTPAGYGGRVGSSTLSLSFIASIDSVDFVFIFKKRSISLHSATKMAVVFAVQPGASTSNRLRLLTKNNKNSLSLSRSLVLSFSCSLSQSNSQSLSFFLFSSSFLPALSARLASRNHRGKGKQKKSPSFETDCIKTRWRELAHLI